ncbi:hypothetical protein HOU00_gp159 [Caulobacter phage CcrPW]|uniref:Uncharacterized protein n=1 Tax=Caulobacter phage CcrPW TaxID=2283271 RepID=A0A385EB72_9CAUD|nr:hypothetical protein HOU00_gp159 [Caulobacter phage CcrPW]AXQ68966.1 hypothetical protein CcrPW_gp427c [Caulobacter phage CcrPW]
MPLMTIAQNREHILQRMREGGEAARRLLRTGQVAMVARWNPTGLPEMSLSRYSYGSRAFTAAKRMVVAGEIVVVGGSLENGEANLLAGPNFPKEA